MDEEGVTNPVHRDSVSEEKKVKDVVGKSNATDVEKDLPLSELYLEKDGRKEKEILIFRIKDIPDHMLSKWVPKKNEYIRETCVEQYFEEMHCKTIYMLQYYGVVARRPEDMDERERAVGLV